LSVVGGSGSSQHAQACLFTIDPQHPVRIEGNSAVHDGGGIYLKPVAGGQPSFASVEGSDYRITANSAQEGSAIFLDSDYSTTGYDSASSVNLQRGCDGESLPSLGAVACTSEECNRIDGNVAQNISGQATAGSTVFMQAPSNLAADPVRIIDNHSAHAIRVIGGYTSGTITYTSDLSLKNCLIAENVVESDLVLAGSETSGELRNCTIADNVIGAGSVAVKAGGILDLFDDIFAQGQTPSLLYTGGNPNNLSIDYVLSMEVASLAQGSHVVQADPSFVDAGSGDYHLLPISPAIDRAPPVAGDDRDLDGLPRDQDIASVANLDGVRDLGAYERQLRYCGAADTIFCNGFEP
jgi:predicted outer membrane repeat protein